MKGLRILAIACLFAAASCDRSITSSVFEASLEMVTGVVDDGGKMSFKVFCSQDSFTVKDLACEFSDDNVICDDRSYSVTDGLCTFTFSDVTVTEDHNGELSFTVCGDGGAAIPVSAVYYCQTFRPEMTVTPSAVSSGGRLKVRVTGNHPYWTLAGVTCTADIDGVPSLGTYPSGQEFDVRVTEAAGTVVATHTLTLTVRDMYLDCEKTLTGEFRLNKE